MLSSTAVISLNKQAQASSPSHRALTAAVGRLSLSASCVCSKLKIEFELAAETASQVSAFIKLGASMGPHVYTPLLLNEDDGHIPATDCLFNPT